ncbi:hypothetical protein FSARC_661 [Fusarium sarcochroum]|uniref:Uncharacterized protein n=1 Tax=Fusarium sarcochroum TaxID=1208366 RepID=A0A8H4UAI0_9HYPO|nr:hypothetical protein FSARC_661 [Fusarium sarcochroum]
MCKPVRYVYPDCGHPIDLDPEVWILERCRLAHRSNRDCWLPNDIPDQFIEDKPWPNDNLTESCPMVHEIEEPQISEHEELQNPVVDGWTDVVEEVDSDSATLGAEDQDDDDDKAVLITRDMLFDESMIIDDDDLLIEEEELLLDEDELLLDDEQMLIDEEEILYYEQATLTGDADVFLSDNDLDFINQIIQETTNELNMAATDDIVAWAQDINATGEDNTALSDNNGQSEGSESMDLDEPSSD